MAAFSIFERRRLFMSLLGACSAVGEVAACHLRRLSDLLEIRFRGGK